MRKRAFGWTFAGLLSVSCGGADRMPSSASVIPASTSATGGFSLAAGAECAGTTPDAIVGPGALTLERLRMDRQTPGGVSVLRQYACGGATYRISPGETIELWAEWSGAASPRIRIDWGAGEPNSPDATSCGSCLLRHAYPTAGLYRVTVTLDDRVSTTVTRTFLLDARDSMPTARVSIVCSPVGPPALAPRAPSMMAPVSCHGAIGVQAGGEGKITGLGFDCSSLTGGTCALDVPLGTVLTVNATGNSISHRVVSWQGACAGIGATGTYNETCTFTVKGDTTFSVVFQGFGI